MAQRGAQRRIGTRLLTISLIGLVICVGLASSRLRGLLANTALLAGGAAAISLPLGTFLALAIAKTSLPGRRFLQGLLVALLFIPLYVQAAAWQAALGQGGWFAPLGAQGTLWLAGWRGAVWVHGMAAVPWVVLLVGAALKNVPREFEEESLQDVRAWRVLLRVSLRRAAASIGAAALWIGVICASEIAVTDLFQVRTFAEEIYVEASFGALGASSDVALGGETLTVEEASWLTASDLWWGTLAVLLLACAALAAAWSWFSAADFTSPADPWVWQLRQGRWALAWSTWLLAAVVVGVPVVSLLGKAGTEVQRVDGKVVRDWSASKAARLILKSPVEHRREWGWSFTIGGLAAVAATSIGVLLAWALRTGRLPAAPTAVGVAFGFSVPGPLLGVWLIRLLNRPPDSPLFFLAWCYDHTILAPVVAQTLRALPLATLVMWSQLASVPQDVLDSAASEGAGWWRQLLAVALPMRWAAVVATACMAMVVAVGDLAATLLVAPPGVSTLSVRIFGLLHYGAEDRVSALCLALALTLGALAILAWQLSLWWASRSEGRVKGQSIR